MGEKRPRRGGNRERGNAGWGKRTGAEDLAPRGKGMIATPARKGNGNTAPEVSGTGKETPQACHAAGPAPAQVVFPDACDAPAKGLEFAVYAPVAGAVGLEFPPPEGAIAGRLAVMPWAAMPEAAVNKNGQAGCGKDKIRPPEQRPPSPPSGDAVGPQEFDHPQFGFLVSRAADAGHAVGTGIRRKHVSHVSAPRPRQGPPQPRR